MQYQKLITGPTLEFQKHILTLGKNVLNQAHAWFSEIVFQKVCVCLHACLSFRFRPHEQMFRMVKAACVKEVNTK